MGEDNSFDLVGAIVGSAIGLIGLAIAIAALVGVWNVFTKAGKPGFYSIIPILNMWTLVEITGLPVAYFWYWVISLVLTGVTAGFSGFVGLFVIYILMRELRRAFGQSDDIVSVIVFIIFSGITLPILGLGSASYRGPQNSADVPALPWIK